MNRVTVDWHTLSQLAGWGDGCTGVEDGDPLALAVNAFSSFARRLAAYQYAVMTDDSVDLQDVLNCERERCEALAKVFLSLKREGKAKGSEQEGNIDG